MLSDGPTNGVADRAGWLSVPFAVVVCALSSAYGVWAMFSAARLNVPTDVHLVLVVVLAGLTCVPFVAGARSWRQTGAPQRLASTLAVSSGLSLVLLFGVMYSATIGF